MFLPPYSYQLKRDNWDIAVRCYPGDGPYVHHYGAEVPKVLDDLTSFLGRSFRKLFP